MTGRGISPLSGAVLALALLLLAPQTHGQDLTFQETTPFFYNFTEQAGIGLLTLLTAGTGNADSARVFLDGVERSDTLGSLGQQPLVATTLACQLGLNPGQEHSVFVDNELGGAAAFTLGINLPLIDATDQTITLVGTSLFVDTRVYVNVPGGATMMRVIFDNPQDTTINTAVDVLIDCPPSAPGSPDYETTVPSAPGSQEILEVDTSSSPPLQPGQRYTIAVRVPRLFLMNVGACFTAGCVAPPPVTTSASTTGGGNQGTGTGTGDGDDASAASSIDRTEYILVLATLAMVFY